MINDKPEILEQALDSQLTLKHQFKDGFCRRGSFRRLGRGRGNNQPRNQGNEKNFGHASGPNKGGRNFERCKAKDVQCYKPIIAKNMGIMVVGATKRSKEIA